jgi:hypothetical protein
VLFQHGVQTFARKDFFTSVHNGFTAAQSPRCAEQIQAPRA